jgi:uncharacterized protein (DUF1697 family)
MPTFIALLRAVNVGGTGKLPMTDLTRLCSKAGFTDVQTYIASSNVVFDSNESAHEVKAALEASLKRYAGKPVGVVVRTGPEMAAVLEANPFRKAPPNSAVAIFLDAPPPRDALDTISGQKDEKVALGRRDLRLVRRRHGKVEAQDSRRGTRHRTQHEYRGQAGGDGSPNVIVQTSGRSSSGTTLDRPLRDTSQTNPAPGS